MSIFVLFSNDGTCFLASVCVGHFGTEHSSAVGHVGLGSGAREKANKYR